MEKGRSVGSYFLFLIREGLFRLRRELWGWRGLAALFIAAYLVVDLLGAMESGRTTMGQGIAIIWMVFLFPPRMGKLLYLLPFSKKERCHYLLMYLCTYFVFQVLVFVFTGAFACLVSGYVYWKWLKFLVFCTFPFLLMYSGIMVFTVAVQKEPKDSYFWVTPFYGNGAWQQEANSVEGIREDYGSRNGEKQKKKKRKELTDEEWQFRKREIWFNIITTVGALVTGIQVYICPVFFGTAWGDTWWFWVGAVLAYISAFAVVWVSMDRAWEQINKKGSTGKEEGVCNS